MSLLPNGSGASSNNVIFPTNSTLDGVPYKSLVAKWWTWFLGIPNDVHPIKNPSDINRCSKMQVGPVWFLSQSFSYPNDTPIADRPSYDYKCHIPFGKVLMLQITSTECDLGTETRLKTDDPIKTDNNLKACTENFKTTPRTMEVIIDRTKVDMSKIGSVIDTDFFNVTYPANHLDDFTVDQGKGTFRAIAAGYYLFIHDLPVGIHNISLRVVDQFNDKPDETSEATYEIFISDPQM